jgi:uncharacterized protein (DUF433 family)
MSATLTAEIEKSPDVCGGDARIANTRVPVWLLVAYRQDGLKDRDILKMYPDLTQEDLSSAWWYYAEHREEIDEARRLQDEA